MEDIKMSNQDLKKKNSAYKALEFVEPNSIIGVGSGSTVNYFIQALSTLEKPIKGAVASSKASEELLAKYDIPVYSANDVSELDIYVDGADEINPQNMMIKGGGAALTREKIVAALAKKFICIIDESKQVDVLGNNFSLPIEVIPMARSQIGRKIVSLGGFPVYREGVITDNGNVIIDVANFPILEPIKMEQILNNIAGVVTNGIFAQRGADVVIVGTCEGAYIR